MGLDMFLFKANKKMNQEELDNIKLVRNYASEDSKDMINNFESMDFLDFLDKHFHHIKDHINTLSPVSEQMYEEKAKKLNLEHGYEVYKEMAINKREKYINQSKEHIKSKVDKIKKALEVSAKYTEDYLNSIDITEIAYWRKHSDLHGYIEEKFYNGDEEFNCIDLVLNKEDIECIIDDHEKHLDEENGFNIGASSGFFWGQTDIEDWKGSLEDFKRVLKETNWDSETVYYSSWW